MDQDNKSQFDSEPFQPYDPNRPAPGGAQVYGTTPNPPPPPSQGFSTPPPYVPPAPPKKNNRRLWTILIIVLVLLCCCCIALVLAGNYAYNNGDAWVIEMCRQDPSLEFCP